MSAAEIFEGVIYILIVGSVYAFIILGYLLITKFDKILKEKADQIRELEHELQFYKKRANYAVCLERKNKKEGEREDEEDKGK